MNRSAIIVTALILLGAFGCKTPRTQIMVTTDTDLAIPTELDAIAIEVRGPSGQMVSANADVTALPAFLGVFYESGPLEPVTVRVVGRLAGADVIERRAEAAFQPERTVVLSMNLLSSCLATTCGAGQTCGEAGCRDEAVGVAELVDWTGTPPGLDGGPMDSSVDSTVDSTTDSTVDTAVDTRVDTGPCVVPEAETCNGADDDCDMMIDEDFDLRGDIMNCGRCGNVCMLANATSTCTAGTCEIASCDGTFLDCDMAPGTGCETNPASDDAHCGGCRMPCGASSSCSGGTCNCTPPLVMGPGGCVDTMRDPLNCGAIGTACNPSQLCSAGGCTCRPGLTNAGGGNCVDTSSDPMNCGMVGTVCMGVMDSCRTSVCLANCGALDDCAGACTDVVDDVFNCGACGNACSASQVCSGGMCRDYGVGLGCAMCPCPSCDAGETCCGYPTSGAVVCVDGPCP